MRFNLKILSKSIEVKLAGALLIVVSLMGIAFTNFNYRQQESIFLERNEEESKLLVSLLEANFAQPLAELKLEEIKFMFEYVFKDPKMIYGYVFDEENKLLINGVETGIYPEDVALDSLAVYSLAHPDTGMVVHYSENLLNVSTPIIYNNQKVGLLCLGISLDEIKEELGDLRTQNIIVSLVFILGSMIVSFFVSRKISRPILQLTESISKTSKGNYDEHIKIKTGDELQTLAEAYNEMIKNLSEMRKHITQERDRAQKYLDIAGVMIIVLDKYGHILLINKKGLNVLGYGNTEIIGKNWFDEFYKTERKNKIIKEYFDVLSNKHFDYSKSYQYVLNTKSGERLINWNYSPVINERNENIGLICAGEDITEKKAAELELIKAKEAAETSDRLKSEFLAQMSHEIRTPVNIILNFAYLIKEETEALVDKKFSKYYDSIELAGIRLIRTIDSILNMSQLETGTYDTSFKYLDIFDDIIMKLKRELVYKAETKNLKLYLNKKTSNSRVHVDEYSITQAFANLIDNAIKYTNKGSVTIDVEGEDNYLTVAISDTGIGISEEFLPFVFSPFAQEEQGYSRSFEGNGLGLSLVKRYCEINNAEITVESQKDVGTTFRIRFQRNRKNNQTL